ncbi:hypothetical protein D9756_011040 [Leucocoprinus leucothites]|uniref:Macrofage activating glycoprotein n=1 Tax=Leucocoprinus leucothites TaxID=201217 RepID=A0A8H5FQZ6_9AGAR|nr:hypothetical protein D9756_011040 [Leucoagaricus leucothites]
MFSLPLALAALAVSARAQITGTFPATPLASKTGFTYPSGIPEKVDTDTGLIRGTQFGYNICNSTTENQNSNCQTAFFNGLDDFCLWAPAAPNSTVADLEGEMVAWCTKPGRGTRLIPAGALQGVQYIKTPDYAQVVGFIDQTQINLQADDFGGEMDPHGADLRGNPMGGILFTSIFSTDGNMQQAPEWNNFMGGKGFCFKVCNPNNPDSTKYCQNIYDRIGCVYNVPNTAQNGTFEACQGDNMDPPPPESLGPITSIPYSARIPPSSNCVPTSSAAIFTALPSPTNAPSASAPVTTVVSTGSDGSMVTLTQTGSAAAASNTNTSGAETLTISGVSILGAVIASLFFA